MTIKPIFTITEEGTLTSDSVETASSDEVFEKSKAKPKSKGIRVLVELEDSLEPAILTDDGLIFEDYDLEKDEMRIDLLGEEPTEAYYNAACALQSPITYLLDQCTWLGDTCWGMILCDWAAEALSISSADMHVAMLEDLKIAKLYWTEEGDARKKAIEISDIIYKKLWKRPLRACSRNYFYERWFNNTTSLAVVAMQFPLISRGTAVLCRSRQFLPISSKDQRTYVLNAWSSLIVATASRKLEEIQAKKHYGDWKLEEMKISAEREAAKIYATATIRKIIEYQELGYGEQDIECHCNKQDFMLTVGIDKIKSMQAWRYDDPWEDED